MALQRREQSGDDPARIDARLAGYVGPPEPRWRAPAPTAALTARQPLGLEPEAPMELVAAAQVLGLVAVERDVKRAAMGETDPDSALTSARAANPGQRRSDSRLSASSFSSPQDASPTGASMPAATPVAPAAGRSRSSTQTRAPARPRATPQASPITPPPTKIASYPLRFVCHRAPLRPMRSNLPAPALPGSGSDGRRRFSRPLSPWWAPVARSSYPCRPLLGSDRRPRPTRLIWPRPSRSGRCGASDSVGAALLRLRRPAPRRGSRGAAERGAWRRAPG